MAECLQAASVSGAIFFVLDPMVGQGPKNLPGRCLHWVSRGPLGLAPRLGEEQKYAQTARHPNCYWYITTSIPGRITDFSFVTSYNVLILPRRIKIAHVRKIDCMVAPALQKRLTDCPNIVQKIIVSWCRLRLCESRTYICLLDDSGRKGKQSRTSMMYETPSFPNLIKSPSRTVLGVF